MSLTGILLAVLLGLGGAAVVLLPWWAHDEDESVPAAGRLHGTERQNRAYETLWAEKLRVLRSLRDLDFDYDMGKLSPDMYVSQRESLVRLGVAIMQRLDALEDEIAAQQARVDDAVAEFRQHFDRAQF